MTDPISKALRSGAAFRAACHQPQLPAIAPPVQVTDPPTSDDRCTPPNVLACVSQLWPGGIDLDPCSNPWSLVQARTRWTKTDDALGKSWMAAGERGTIWLNPPFSNPTPFVRELVTATTALRGESLLLVRHDSTTAWWRFIEDSADALCFVRDRVRFRLAGEDTGPADHATTIAFFTRWSSNHPPTRARRVTAFSRCFDPLGLVCAVPR